MTEALLQALWRSAAALLMLLPFALMARTRLERAGVAGVSGISMALGGLLWWMPFVEDTFLKGAILQGNTLLAALLMLAAIVSATTGVTEWISARTWSRWTATALVLVPIFILDGVELTDQLRQLAFLKDSGVPYAVGAITIAVAIALCVPLAGLMRRSRLERFIAPWSALIFLPAVRAAFEPFLITAVEGAVARVMHDFMHLLIVFILLPDHAYLSGFLWNLIGLTFRKSTSTVLNLVVFLGVTGYLIAHAYFARLPVHSGVKAAERRSCWAEERAARRRASLPAYIAIALFAVLAVRAASYRSAPTPPDREQLITQTSAGNTMGVIDAAVLKDTKLHVWTYEAGGKSMRVFAIQKPEGEVAVCLDACLVCAPDGYAELGQDLFCLYCGTPIPMSTVGEPGGCNPVPLADVKKSGTKYLFDADKALAQWLEVTGGK